MSQETRTSENSLLWNCRIFKVRMTGEVQSWWGKNPSSKEDEEIGLDVENKADKNQG